MIIAQDAHAPIQGVFSLRIYRRGKLIEEYRDHNLIVDSAKTVLANLVAGVGSGNAIITIGFGTNASGPSSSDTALTGAYLKTIQSYRFPSAGQIEFSWELLASEASGLSISEFGLVCVDGSLFARKTRRQPIQKDTDISLEGTWLIIF